jgi:hypothetical protein
MKVVFIIALVLIINPFSLSAELYKWTDDKGMINFGDNVPDQYKNIASNIKVKVNVVETVRSPTFTAYTPPKRKNDTIKYGLNNQNNKTDTTCKAHWERYRKSKSCFDSCGISITNSYGGIAGRNMSSCRGCIDVKKPKCRL